MIVVVVVVVVVAAVVFLVDYSVGTRQTLVVMTLRRTVAVAVAVVAVAVVAAAVVARFL